MANFCYKAISAKGKTVRGLVEADTERQAIASVREKGLVPLSVESASASVANPGKPSSKSSFKKILESLHPVPKTAVAAMARQLATLLHAGLPLDEALASICAHDDASRMQGIVSRLRDRIMAGGDLADGLAEFPNVFSSTFVTMVRAGEASGTLELVIERFAEHIEQQVALVRKVQATLAYPILMLFVGIGVVIFLLTFVIPKVTQIFSDMGRALPVPTQILLAVSDDLTSFTQLGLVMLRTGGGVNRPSVAFRLDDANNDEWVTCPPGGILAIGTMKIPNADTPRDFFIALDNGDNVLPADTADIRNRKYTVAEGQRVFVGYLQMGKEKPGYENGKIFTIEDILTKEIIPLTEATADSIGDDRINVTAHALTKDYLTIEYQYLGSMNENKKHMLNLVQNEITGPIKDDGYIYLEFRHNAFNDSPNQLGSSLVSFKLDSIAEQLATAKGIKLRVNTIYDNIQYVTIDINEDKNLKIKSFHSQ